MSLKKRATHLDVARLAGVSPGVVSYVVNNGPRRTTPETRQRVLAAIAELDYQPNASARGLRNRKTHTIGYISADYYPLEAFVGPYNAGIMTGLSMALRPHECYMLPYAIGLDEDLAGLQGMLRSARLDGVVVRLTQDPPITDRLLEVIARAHVPCVCIERRAGEQFAFSAVTYEDEGGAHLATRYLVDRGYTRIAHIQGDTRQMAARDRLAGYRRALREGGLPVEDALIQGGSWLSGAAAEAMGQLLRMPSPPEAVFAASDALAFAAIEVAREHGYQVPADIAVVGFDDVPLASEMRPPLTTVQIPFAEIGRLAAAHILRLAYSESTEVGLESVNLKLIRRGTA